MLEDRPNLKSTCNDTVWKPKKKEEQPCIFVMYKPVRLQDMYILLYRPIEGQAHYPMRRGFLEG